MSVGFSGNVSHINRLVKAVKQQPNKVYDLMNDYGINTDSIVREKIFAYITDKWYDGDYNKVYNQWLNN